MEKEMKYRGGRPKRVFLFEKLRLRLGYTQVQFAEMLFPYKEEVNRKRRISMLEIGSFSRSSNRIFDELRAGLARVEGVSQEEIDAISAEFDAYAGTRAKQCRSMTIDMTIAELQERLGVGKISTLVDGLREAGIPVKVSSPHTLLYDLEPFLKRCGIPNLDEQLRTAPQIAETFRVTEAQLVRAAKDGTLPVIRLSFEKGSRYYFLESQVRAMLQIYVEEHLSFWNHFKHLRFMRDFVKRFTETVSPCFMSDREREVFRRILIEGESVDDVALADGVTSAGVYMAFNSSSKKVMLEMDAFMRDIEHVADLEERCRQLDEENAQLRKAQNKPPRKPGSGQPPKPSKNLPDEIARELTLNVIRTSGIPGKLTSPIVLEFGISTLDELLALNPDEIVRSVPGFGKKRMFDLERELALRGKSFPGKPEVVKAVKRSPSRRHIRIKLDGADKKTEEND